MEGVNDMKYLLLVLLVSGCSGTVPTSYLDKKSFNQGWYKGYEYGMDRKSCTVYKMTEGVAVNGY